MKRIYIRTLFSMFIFSITFFSCTEKKVYIDDLDLRADQRHYKVGADEPFTGIAYSSYGDAEWEYRTGREIRATGFYKNGNKRHETFNGSMNTQYYDPNGLAISSEEYGKKYTPTQGYE